MFLIDTLVLDMFSDLQAKLVIKIFHGSSTFITLGNEC